MTKFLILAMIIRENYGLKSMFSVNISYNIDFSKHLKVYHHVDWMIDYIIQILISL